MSLSIVQSRALLGMQAQPVCVEVHLANGLPSFTLVGLAETEVKEARERVRSAIQNTGLEFPANKRITVNLAPADLPKDSGRFDLPIALGILAASGQLDAKKMHGYEFAGELSLGGDLRPVRGALAMSLALSSDVAYAQGPPPKLVLPESSAQEAGLVPGAEIYKAHHLLDVVRQFLPGDALPDVQDGWSRVHTPERPASSHYANMADVKGQAAARRALEIAAAGGHSILMMGAPGSGKSMLAQRFAGLLPDMTTTEALERAAVASLVGRFSISQWAVRPTCAPHHTASAVALVGGGSPPRPGEISLAHRGVLFLDELPEFPRAALEALRVETLATRREKARRGGPAKSRQAGVATRHPPAPRHWRCGAAHTLAARPSWPYQSARPTTRRLRFPVLHQPACWAASRQSAAPASTCPSPVRRPAARCARRRQQFQARGVRLPGL